MTDEELIDGLYKIKAWAEVAGHVDFWETASSTIRLLEQQPSYKDFIQHEKEVLERIDRRDREIDKYIQKLAKLEQHPCNDKIENFIKNKIDYLEDLVSIETNEGRWREEEKYLYAVSVLEEVVEYIAEMSGGDSE